MEEEKGGGGDSSRASSSFLKAGDRQMFTLELRPGETTIVSWKKLVKDANKVNGPSTSAPEPPANAHPGLESRIARVRPSNPFSIYALTSYLFVSRLGRGPFFFFSLFFEFTIIISMCP